MIYSQSTGILKKDNGEILGQGYSGHGVGKNNPEMQSVKNVGPIPEGNYQLGKPFNSDHTGDYSIPLIPDPENEMYGRSQFLCHGDDREHPGEASLGCIIQSRLVRQTMIACGERLKVTK
jgi:hypothetical protein